LVERVAAIPGVRSASMAQFTPTEPRGLSMPLTLPSGEEKAAFAPMVYPKYFATMGIPVVAGRDFDARDQGENAPLVVLVNETLARQAFPEGNPVGRQIRAGRNSREVIGVVKDSRYTSLRGETPATMYQTFLQADTGRGQMALHVRVAGEAGHALLRVREAVQSIDKDLPIFPVHTLGQEIDAVLIRERMLAMLASFFGILALLLACVGLYGLFAFTVVQRTGEMGIRMALGAQRSRVMWTVLREALVLVSIGVALGVPAALVASRLAASQISGLLFGLNAGDPVTIAAAIAVLATAAAMAGYLPARRASRVDPIVALRNE